MQVLLAVVAANALFLVLMGLGARAVHVPVTKFVYGFGPTVVKTTVAGAPLEIAPIPLGASVQLEGAGDDDDDDAAPRGFRLLSPAVRVAVILLPWAAFLAAAALLLGPGEMVATIRRGAGLAWCEIDTARAIWPRILALAATDAWGSVFALMSAMNLVPLPGLAGGAVLQAVLEGRSGRFPRLRKAYQKLLFVTLLLMVLTARWLWALGLALFR